ncbi:MAG: B12-binding domain-containing radical SAM protein [Magnetococcales bacterium]|nr:B12-binding domain-containing radical SAM protein [Magnetococcales bacterium]
MVKDIKNIVLMVQPATVPLGRYGFNINFPMGLGYIAGVLEQANFNVEIIDTLVEGVDQEEPLPDNPNLITIGLNPEQIHQRITACKPDMVGITSMFTGQFANTQRLAEIVKSIDQEIVVVIGGAHATADPKGVLQDHNIDYVVIGEGENVILPLIDAIGSGGDFANLSGISYRHEEQVVVRPAVKMVDVNTIPLPARHLFPMEKYFKAGERHGIAHQGEGFRSASVLTERGCPFDCNFCSSYQIFGKALRYRNADDILAEIDQLVTEYKINDLYLADDQFLADRKRAIKILDGIIDKNYGLHLDAPNGLSPWMINDEVLKKMKQAGFWRLSLAIESGNEWVLQNIIKKPVKLHLLPDLVDKANNLGFEINAFLVVGNVSEDAVETFEQIQDSFDLMKKLKIHNLHVSYLSPHKGTEVYEIALKKGYLAHSFEDTFYNRPKLETPLWTRKQLELFVTIQRLLCLTNDSLLFLPLRMFASSWGGFLLNVRYKIIFGLYTMFRSLKARFA